MTDSSDRAIAQTEPAPVSRPRLRRWLNGAAMLSASNILARLCAFVGVIVMARLLDTAAFATVLLAQAITLYLSIVLDFGLTLTGIRSIASDPALARSVMASVLAIRLVIAGLGSALILLIGLVIGIDSEGLGVVAMFAVAAAVAALDLSWVLQALQSTWLRSVVVGASAIVSLGLLVVLLPRQPEAITVPASQVIGTLLAVAFGIAVTIRGLGWPTRPPRDLFRKLILASIPLGLASLLAQVYYNVDLILLALWRPLEEVAAYGAAYKVIFGLLMVVWTYAVVALPRMTVAFQAGGDALANEVHRNILTIVGCTLPVSIGCVIFAAPILEILFGSSYGVAAVPFAVLAATVPIAAFRTILLYSFTASGRPWAVPISSGPGAVINISLNLMVIPTYGMLGAAVSTLVAELVVTVVAAWQARGTLRRIAWLRWPAPHLPARGTHPGPDQARSGQADG